MKLFIGYPVVGKKVWPLKSMNMYVAFSFGGKKQEWPI